MEDGSGGKRKCRSEMQEVNEIKLETRDAITIMDIQGDITAFSEPFLNDAYQNANTQGAGKILLKFDSNAYINSGGIAVLIQVLAQTQKNNQVIGITGISGHFKKIFHMVGITKFAKIYDSLEDSLEQMA
jgi:anti-anti-sigma factor